jgi:hypothetical protein
VLSARPARVPTLSSEGEETAITSLAGASAPRITVGVDTHLDIHIAHASDQLGRRMDTLWIPTTPTGYQDLLAWARGLGEPVAWSVEGTGSYGDEELAQSDQQLGALERELKSAGAWVVSGRLHDPATATVVRMADGEVLTTDGPFVESKEHLGGFYVIQAEDLDAALGWASRITGAIKVPIEVRPFAGFEA